MIMREIKFRAWHTANKVMFQNKDLSVLAKNIQDDNIWKFMQYTGLKDKKGKGTEIYEGDIFSIHGTIYFVKWSEDGCNFVLTTGRGYDSRNCLDLTCDSIYFETILGNIHENPELLN